MKLIIPFLVPLLLCAMQTGWQANPQIVRGTSAKQPEFNYEESRVPPYTLPDPLTGAGARVRTPDEWRKRRAEILELFEEMERPMVDA